jgi:hypothetical protein
MEIEQGVDGQPVIGVDVRRGDGIYGTVFHWALSFQFSFFNKFV